MRTTEPPPSARGSLAPSLGLAFYKYHGLGNDFVVIDFALKPHDVWDNATNALLATTLFRCWWVKSLEATRIRG